VAVKRVKATSGPSQWMLELRGQELTRKHRPRRPGHRKRKK